MLVLTCWAGMTHAAEAAGGRIADFQVAVHAPGDGDEVPGDGDNALPHHHGSCHGHDIGAPILPPSAAFHCTTGRAPQAMADDRVLIAAEGSVALRPPQA